MRMFQECSLDTMAKFPRRCSPRLLKPVGGVPNDSPMQLPRSWSWPANHQTTNGGSSALNALIVPIARGFRSSGNTRLLIPLSRGLAPALLPRSERAICQMSDAKKRTPAVRIEAETRISQSRCFICSAVRCPAKVSPATPRPKRLASPVHKNMGLAAQGTR